MTRDHMHETCLLLRRLPMFTELQYLVKTFLFYDRTLVARQHMTKMTPVHSDLHRALSRRNGFGGVEPPDTLCEYWVFAAEDYHVALQSVNCRWCGNFLLTSRIELSEMSPRALCECDRYIFYPDPAVAF